MPKRNHAGADQARRASQHRGTRPGAVGGTKAMSRPNVNSHTAALGPAEAAFSMQRVEYNQCVEYQLMDVGNQSDVKEYFAKNVAEVIDKHYGFDTPMPILASKLSDVLEEMTAHERDQPNDECPFLPIDQLLDLQYISLGQITLVRNPSLDQRPSPANSTEYAGAETWESYIGTVDAGTSKEKTEQFVQAPQALVRRFTPIPSAVPPQHVRVDAAATPLHSSHSHFRRSLSPTQASHTTLPTRDSPLATPYADSHANPRRSRPR